VRLQFSIVVYRVIITAALALLMASNAAAQSGQESRWMNIMLLGAVPSEKVHIDYVLEGPFGGSGNFMRPKPDTPVYRISTYVGGKPADQIKGFIWAPGCRMMKFDDLLVGSADVQEYFSCSPLGTVKLVGRIHGAPLSKKPMEVRVDYLAHWACGFFGFMDCMVPEIEVGIATPDADGTFEIELPDFAADPIASGPEGGAEFQLVLREVKPWNLVAFLAPETETLQTLDHGLKIVPSYPQDLVFSTRKVD
jgi:hypothetical protein